MYGSVAEEVEELGLGLGLGLRLGLRLGLGLDMFLIDDHGDRTWGANVRVRARVGYFVRVRVRFRVACFFVTGGHDGVLCVRQCCGRRR